MSTPAYDAGRLALMLNELRLPTIARPSQKLTAVARQCFSEGKA